MLHPTAIETALAQLPAWIQVDFEEARRKAARSANFQFWQIAAQGGAQQYHSIIAGDHAEAILQRQILTRYPNRKAVTVGVAIAHARKVEVQQQRLHGLGSIGIDLPTQALIVQLLQNQQAMCGSTPWLRQDNKLTLIHRLFVKHNLGRGHQIWP